MRFMVYEKSYHEIKTYLEGWLMGLNIGNFLETENSNSSRSDQMTGT